MIAETVRIPVPGGRLQGTLAYPADQPPSRTIVLAGPHPLLGGDMQNNVLVGLEAQLVVAGSATLRFNYAGVGESDGPDALSIEQLNAFLATSHMADETRRHEDLAAALHFATSTVGQDVPLAIIGYSFGCAVISAWLEHDLSATSRLDPQAIVCIAPTIGRHDYGGMSASSVPKLVLASRDDFATPSDVLREAVSSWTEPKRLVLAELDDHFFRGCEAWLSGQIVPFLETTGRVTNP